MPSTKPHSSWWRKFLGLSPGGSDKAVAILSDRYIDESLHAARFKQHAQKMQYPQFRQRLLKIADQETEHARWIGEKIRSLGGQLPAISEISPNGKNSWQYLMADLESERQCAVELDEQVREIRPDFPELVEMLERIREDGTRHRQEIREMLMRSDPQALWPA